MKTDQGTTKGLLQVTEHILKGSKTPQQEVQTTTIMTMTTSTTIS